MESIERTIRVSWQHRVLFSDHVFNPGNPTLKEVLAGDDAGGQRKALVVVDAALASAQPGLLSDIETYFARHGARLRLVCPPLARAGGEVAKNSWTPVAEIHESIDRYHVDRHSYVVAVGGGALLDLVGLAAATAHRGVRHVRLPSTTLSQCDSGVGVKNGINAFGKKNFIGTFTPPVAVINDFQFLASLAPRDKRAGYAEAVKVACIRDAAFFDWLEAEAKRLRAFTPESMRQCIRRCAELHVNHIATSGDPFERGSARPLDFGHWAAHKLEQLSRFELRHGEAVAIGIALDVLYSRRMGYLDPHSADRVVRLLERLGFHLFAPELRVSGPAQASRLLEGLEEFREHLGGNLAITLLEDIGAGMEVREMEAPVILEAIRALEDRQVAAPAPALVGS